MKKQLIEDLLVQVIVIVVIFLIATNNSILGWVICNVPLIDVWKEAWITDPSNIKWTVGGCIIGAGVVDCVKTIVKSNKAQKVNIGKS